MITLAMFRQGLLLITLQRFFELAAHLLLDPIGRNDPCHIPKLEQPCEKGRAYRDFQRANKSGFVVLRDGNLIPEPIDHLADQGYIEQNCNPLRLPSKHTECLLRIFGGIQCTFHGATIFFRNLNAGHFIHTKMRKAIVSCVPSDKVVVFIIPSQQIGADTIYLARPSEVQSLIQTIFLILKGDLLAAADGVMQDVHVIVNLLIW